MEVPGEQVLLLQCGDTESIRLKGLLVAGPESVTRRNERPILSGAAPNQRRLPGRATGVAPGDRVTASWSSRQLTMAGSVGLLRPLWLGLFGSFLRLLGIRAVPGCLVPGSGVIRTGDTGPQRDRTVRKTAEVRT